MTTARITLTVAAAAVALGAACASHGVPAARFANTAAVTRVDDRRDVPRQPAQREFVYALYHYDGIVERRLTRAMELPRPRRALGVNALDEVPDSTWFTNRIGVRALTPDEIRTGPAHVGDPELHKPWTVHATKTGGTEVGLVITDARGEKFLLKFDTPGFPEQVTAAHVIVGKLLWACGYNVTDDYVVMLEPRDLVLAPDATSSDVFGAKHPLRQPELDAMLRQIERAPDGRLRGMASLWLAGKPLGGHPAEGVRDDDPNDRIPHQLRRDLRGSYPIFAWLEHVDIQESNYLDTWIEDGGRHYVKHYFLDFGKALGVMNSTAYNRRHGREYAFDIAVALRTLGTLGVEKRPWEDKAPSRLRGIGMFDAGSFDPAAWKPLSPAYVPFLTADRLDKFWGTKIMMRLSRADIRAAVEAGRLSDPRAVDYLTDTLVARQRATARTWFAQVNPLDGFAIASSGPGDALCFDDLALVYQLGPDAAATRYRITAFDDEARSLGGATIGSPDAAGHACIGSLPLAPGQGYTILRVETQRAGFAGETYVHVARDPATAALRVIGVWRS